MMNILFLNLLEVVKLSSATMTMIGLNNFASYMERDLFEKYISHWDTLDKECEEYKNNIKELYENSVTVAENETRLSNDEKLNIKMGVFIAFIVISILCFIILGTKGCSGETSHSDGKCDICNNAKYSSINGEEFCYEHYKNAIDYYLDD